MPEAVLNTTTPHAMPPPNPVRDRIHALMCDLGSAWDVLTQTVEIMEDAADSDDPPPLRALIRLIRAVEEDVKAAHVALDRLWLDSGSHRTEGA